MRDDNIIGDMVAAAAQNIKERDYWLNKLSGELEKSYFPVDNRVKGSDKKGHRPAAVEAFLLENELFSQLMKLSNGFDYSLHMILAAAVVVLLKIYSGNKDIIVGAPIYKQDIEGKFVNTILALRNTIRDDMSFKNLLLEVREALREATENQNYPIESLLYQLHIEMSENEFPLFDVAILLENIHDKSYLQHIDLNMIFSFKRTDTQVECLLEYNSSMYLEDTVKRIISHFINLLRVVLFDLDAAIVKVDIFSREEKTQLLYDFNDTRVDYPEDPPLTVHRLAAAQAKKSPESTAILVGDSGQSISYGDLNEKAEGLALLLQKKGVAPGKIVGLMVERSPEMIIGMLGILKAGGAYLPIDAGHPGERIAYMLKDSEANLLLTQRHLNEECDCIPGIDGNIERIDLTEKSIYWTAGGQFPDTTDPSGLTYVIYTSGSTGRAKGVAVEHRSIVNTLLWRKDYYQFDEKDVIMQVLGYTFDSSVEDIFTTLISGARLVIIPQENIYDLQYLRNVIRHTGVTYFLIVPGFYKSFLQEIAEDLKGLRAVTVAGDSITEKLVKTHFEKLSHVELYNEYGPTENSVCSTVYRFPADDPKVLIGKPISNVNCFILGNGDQLCPIGVPGELCVSGRGLAREYLKRPQLTAEKFVTNPFREGQRMYRTGDLVRWLADGNIEFLGRIDHQVKIRGFRIELGEIESRLLDNPEIKEAVVVAIEEEEKYLCAYMVSEKNLDHKELKRNLSTVLPEYMIPAFFKQLDKIPLTPNGKIDRKALPRPDAGCTASRYAAPRDEIETELVDIWSDILDFEKDNLSIDSSFFDLGGHSLKATVLVSRINKAFDVRVPMAEIFRKPTMRELADYIREFAEEDVYAAIEPSCKKEYYSLSSSQSRLYVLHRMEENNISYNVPIVFVLEGELDEERLGNAFGKLIERHESLRTSFILFQDEPRQKIHDDVSFAVEVHECTAGKEAERNIVRQFIKPFDLANAPLLRAGLIKTAKNRHILMADMHHIISDGVSHGILIDDFMALYYEKELPPLKLQYKDYSEWQNAGWETKQNVMEKQEEYWLKQFEGELPQLNIPTDFPREPLHTFEGIAYHFRVGRERTKALKDLAQQEGVTLHILMFAIFNILLAKKSSREDIVIGTPVAGRRQADLEKIIGLFINTLALRNFPREEMPFLEFLNRVKESFLSAYENQDYPFEDLVKKLDIKRDTYRNPLFDYMFEMMNVETTAGTGVAGEPVNEEAALKAVPYEVEKTTTKMDQDWLGVEVGEDIVINVNYSTRLFRKESIQLIAKEYLSLVGSVLDNTGCKIGELDHRTNIERKLEKPRDVNFKF